MNILTIRRFYGFISPRLRPVVEAGESESAYERCFQICGSCVCFINVFVKNHLSIDAAFKGATANFSCFYWKMKPAFIYSA